MPCADDRYAYQEHCSEYAGIRQKWVLYQSVPMYEREERTFEKNLAKSLDRARTSLRKLCAREFACAPDAHMATRAWLERHPRYRFRDLDIVMVLCLFIYAFTEFRVRRELERTGETVTSQTKKQTQRPTMKWAFFQFRRVREFVVVEDVRRVKRVTNLNEELGKILRLLAREYKKYYT